MQHLRTTTPDPPPPQPETVGLPSSKRKAAAAAVATAAAAKTNEIMYRRPGFPVVSCDAGVCTQPLQECPNKVLTTTLFLYQPAFPPATIAANDRSTAAGKNQNTCCSTFCTSRSAAAFLRSSLNVRKLPLTWSRAWGISELMMGGSASERERQKESEGWGGGEGRKAGVKKIRKSHLLHATENPLLERRDVLHVRLRNRSSHGVGMHMVGLVERGQQIELRICEHQDA